MRYEEQMSLMRRLIGNPTIRDVDDTTLLAHLNDAVARLAVTLEYRMVTFDQAIRLVAGQQEYRLPNECLWVMWAEWNDNRLTPSDTMTWDNQGTNWRGASSSTPDGYAVERRMLIMNPPPSSTAITTDPYVALRAICDIPGITDQGITDMPDADIRLACYMGSIEWLALHPSDEHKMMMDHHEGVRQELFEAARGRIKHEVKPHHMGFQPITGRRGTSR